MRKRARPRAVEESATPGWMRGSAAARARGASERLFYRATGIEALDRTHPGLRAFVDKSLAKRLPHLEITRRAQKRYGVRISPQVLMRHWRRRVRPEEIRFLDLLRESRVKAEMMRKESARFPGGDASKIIDALIAQQIVEDKLKLGQADIMKLAAEQRLRKRLQVEQVRMRLAAKRAREAQSLAEAGLQHERERREGVRGVVESAESAAREGRPFDPTDVYSKIAAVIAGPEAEERVESSVR